MDPGLVTVGGGDVPASQSHTTHTHGFLLVNRPQAGRQAGYMYDGDVCRFLATRLTLCTYLSMTSLVTRESAI